MLLVALTAYLVYLILSLYVVGFESMSLSQVPTMVLFIIPLTEGLRNFV